MSEENSDDDDEAITYILHKLSGLFYASFLDSQSV